MELFADAAFTLIHWLMLILVIGGIIAVFVIIAKAQGWAIPGWLPQVFWVCVAVLVGCLAIKFLAGLL